jgi:DNA-binding transcriptional LysR family regulator
MDEILRRYYTFQIAQERTAQAREQANNREEPAPKRPARHLRWVGLQIRSLLALVAVAEEGSFVGAARRLGYSRSTVSHQIATLEAALGATLVLRGSGSRSVSVTPAGSVIVTYGRAVLRLLASAESQLDDIQRTERQRRLGLVRLSDPDAPPAYS